jgi:hypothetical protein
MNPSVLRLVSVLILLGLLPLISAAPASPWLSGQLALLTVGIALIGLWPGPLIHWTEVIFRTALSVTP